MNVPVRLATGSANEEYVTDDWLQPRRPIDGTGGGGNDGRMEARITRLETQMEKANERLQSIDVRLTKIETRIEEGFKHFATKEDLGGVKTEMGSLKVELHKEFTAQTWRILVIVVVAQLLPAVPSLLRALHVIN